MRYFLISLLTFLTLSASAAKSVMTSEHFAKSSRLASGKWVKVAVDEDGIYEISYETLKNMGFSNPESVGVFGRGGSMMPTEFASSGGQILYRDDLPAVPVFRMNDKIYFYGKGTMQLDFERNLVKYQNGGAFTRGAMNIYSKEGYYFLSDSQEPLLMEEVQIPESPKYVKEFTSGIGVAAHEEDLVYNTHSTGQLYYGEKMTPQQPRLRFQLNLPDAIPGAMGVVQSVVYTDKIRNLPGAYGFENADDVVPTKDLLYSIGDFAPHQPSISELPIPSANPVFYTEIDFDYNSGQDLDVSHLDHWVVSYPKGIPSLKDTEGNDLAQDRIALPNLYYPMVGLIRVPDGMNRVVFDISDPDHPKYYMMQPDGKDSFFYITAGVDTPQLAVMNPLKKQLDVRTVTLGDTEIQNQDLHALAYEGADLIIVTIPALRQAAERLADLHRQYMNQRVIVATTQECYNEFSNGMPDPQGIRSLVKMVHTSDYGCKNLLLMGPLYSDFRGITLDKNPLEGIIAFQSLSTNSERGGFNANDFYGMMTEHIGDTRLEELPMDVGVGILPIRHAAEADIYVAKVEKYITRGDFAYYLNHIVTFGGVGDEDLHSSQVPELDRYISNVGERSLINSQILVDAYGYREAHDKLLRHADEGALLFTYFGHGNTCMLNLTGDFFRASDVYAFSNDFHPFWGFAGCELTVPDKGIRGMGESVVVSTPHGMIGTLLATRDTWSSMNFDLFKKFFSNFLRDGGVSSSKFHKDALTIGEIYARTKSQSKYSNELAYQLVCDPAIVIPQVNRRIILDEESLTAKSGNWLELKGHVAEYDTDEPDSDYNGEVVVRLMAPEVEMACPHLVGKSDKSVGLPKDDIVVTYGDTRLAMGAAEVKDGRFSLRIMIPASAQDFDGERGPLYLAAYDPASRMGAASRFHTVFESAGAEESVLSADTQAPVIERFEYLPESKAICVTVSDDTALAFEISNFYDPFRLVIDGKELRAGASNRPVIDYDSDSYTKTISVNNVSYGPHTAKVIVKDAAGNEAVAELLFDTTPALEKYALSLEGGVVDGEGLFSAIGSIPSSTDIVILNGEGEIINRQPLPASGFRWDATDMNGAKVRPGLYKAYIIETSGNNPAKGHSPAIDVPVI